MSPSDQIIYKALSDAADAGAPCPNNFTLAVIAGYSGPQSAVNSIRRLQRAGLVASKKTPTGREVIITLTGRSCKSLVADEQPRRHVRVNPVPTLPPRQFRDACPYCDVRPEFGCRHGWTGEYFAEIAA
jgi:hypothetical protein